ncbi:hypothetical protein SAMN06298221_1191, partial [Sphaerochaeta associata]
IVSSNNKNSLHCKEFCYWAQKDLNL